MQTQRRVSRLHLKSDCYSDVQRATVLIEDALRTASFPGLPKNGLLLIRRLQLGKVSIANNSSIFSQRIDQQFLTLQPIVIKFGQEEQPHAQVAWFADPIEPYTLLARLLAKNKVPVSWYWPLAVPDWRHSEDTHDDLAQLILSAAQKPHGAIAVAAIFDGLVNDETIDSFMECVSSQQASQILKNMNADPGDLPSINKISNHAASLPVHLSPNWQQSLLKWIPDLDESDRRSFLLAITAAITHDFTTAEFTVAEILHQVAQSTYTNQRNKKYRYNDIVKKIYDNETIAKRPGAEDSKSATNVSYKNARDAETQFDNATIQNELFENGIVELQNPSGLVSQNAGLPFLATVLKRLHIHETLKQYSLLAELNLPSHVIQACIKKINLDPNDVICRWITGKDKLPTTEKHCPFVMPESWLQLLFGQQSFNQHRVRNLSLRRVIEGNDKQLLCDSSGKVALAIWQGKMPDDVISLTKNRKIKLLAPVQEIDDLQVVISTYLFAIQRYLRRYLKTGMRKVVSQKGYVATTKTHLDISYSMQQVDIDIRKAGLDIDPNWVPWLGYVIKYHYLEDEH